MVPFSAIFDIGSKLIDRLLPDPEKKAAAQLELLRLQQTGELDELKTQMSAIVAEAQSSDPWTSRARPSFLYMMYVLVLFGIPMGIVSAVSPQTGLNIASGFKAWLTAIPTELYGCMTVGYLGYVGARSYDKRNGNL